MGYSPWGHEELETTEQLSTCGQHNSILTFTVFSVAHLLQDTHGEKNHLRLVLPGPGRQVLAHLHQAALPSGLISEALVPGDSPALGSRSSMGHGPPHPEASPLGPRPSPRQCQSLSHRETSRFLETWSPPPGPLLDPGH